MKRTVYLALGSNLGDRFEYLQQACRSIAAAAEWIGASPVYETAPVGFTEQGAFLNAVIAVSTPMDPAALLTLLKDIERTLGRQARFVNGPREIDIDILLIEAIARQEAPAVPHPRMHERPFVLQPLVDLAGDIAIPGHGAARHLLEALDKSGLRKYPMRLDCR
jgi:2-amino-4-hydroxy-6-hydroxymethyldihydropteridine diphosphokinase